MKFIHFVNVLYSFYQRIKSTVSHQQSNFIFDHEYLLKQVISMKYFHYLREINIRDYRENYSYDGDSQPYVSENRQYLLICFCDLLYKGETGEKTRIFQSLIILPDCLAIY